MEFGTSAALQCGRPVVGVSWTSPSSSPIADATQLVTTTHTRVQIHAADDQRVIASWLMRPGSNKFVVAAVQHRSTRQLFAVQEGNRLVAWQERQSSLDAAAAVTLPRDVHALRISKHASAIFVVFRDGGVGVYSLYLEELFTVPGVSGAGLKKGKGGAAAAAAGGEGAVATWSRLTSVPSEPGRLVLLVCVQGGGGDPLLRVFSVTPGTPAAPALGFVHRASHTLLPPAAGLRACTLTLHKHFQALAVLWSNRSLSVLRFQRAPHVHAGTAWYTLPPVEALSRTLGSAAPGAVGGIGQGGELAGFALEPSCLVLAGEGAGTGGGRALFLSVWDVRYGVVLGTKEVALEGEEGAPVFAVTVNEDGSYVAAVTRAGVAVTPVAVRGASLASALGRLPETEALLRASGGGASAAHLPPTLSLETMLRGVVTTAGGEGALTTAAAGRWEAAVASTAGKCAADAAALASAPTLKKAAAILAGYGVGEGGAGVAGPLAPSLPPALASAALARIVSDLRANSDGASASLGLAAPILSSLLAVTGVAPSSSPLLIPALLRAACAPPLPTFKGGAPDAAAPGAVTALTLLCDLLRSCPDVPEAVLVAVLRTALHAISAPALASLAEALAAPASLPVHVNRPVLGLLYLVALIVRAPRNDVFLEAALAALSAEDVRTLLAALLRLLHTHASSFVHAPLAVSAEALEGAIAEAQAAARGKAGSKRKGRPAGGPDGARKVGAGAGAVAPTPLPASLGAHLPSYGQVLDWLRMVVDAHFARIVLMAKADGESGGRGAPGSLAGLLGEVARLVKEQVGLSAAAAPLRGHAEHLLLRLPLPAEPEADYSRSVLRLA